MSQCYIHANLVKIHPPVQNPPTGSWDIVQTRDRHAAADANAEANRIRTKNNMSPSPSVGNKITITFEQNKIA